MTDILQIRDATKKWQEAFGRLGYADEVAEMIGCESARIVTLAKAGEIRIDGIVHPANA